MNATASVDASIPDRRNFALVVALGVLQTLSTFTIDIYLPAFPLIATDLGVTESAIQFTFTGAMIGMVSGQFIAGPLSDAVGRRRPLIVATIVHVAASIACAAAPSASLLIAARVVQGVASGATGVIALAMVRDLYSGHRMMKMLASMALISGMAIALGPLLGSSLLTLVPWRGVFVSLASYGLLVGLIVVVVIGESLPESRRSAGGLRTRTAAMGLVIRDRAFVGLVITTSCAWGAMYAYLATSSFLFQRVFHTSAQGYGFLFASHAVLMLIGTQLAARVSRRAEPRHIVMISTAGLGVSALAIVGGALLAPSSLLAVMIPLWGFTFFLGVNTPCIQTMALSRHGDSAGAASSLLNATRQGFGVVATPITGLVGMKSALPLGLIMLIAQAVALVVLWVVVRPHKLESLG